MGGFMQASSHAVLGYVIAQFVLIRYYMLTLYHAVSVSNVPQECYILVQGMSIFFPSLRLIVAIGRGSCAGLLYRLLLLSNFSLLSTTPCTSLVFILVLTTWSSLLCSLFKVFSPSNSLKENREEQIESELLEMLPFQMLKELYISFLIFLILFNSWWEIDFLANFNIILLCFFWAFICLCILFSVFRKFLVASLCLYRRLSKSFLVLAQSNLLHYSLE